MKFQSWYDTMCLNYNFFNSWYFAICTLINKYKTNIIILSLKWEFMNQSWKNFSHDRTPFIWISSLKENSENVDSKKYWWQILINNWMILFAYVAYNKADRTTMVDGGLARSMSGTSWLVLRTRSSEKINKMNIFFSWNKN